MKRISHVALLVGVVFLGAVLNGCDEAGSGGGGGGYTLSGTIDDWSLGSEYTVEARDSEDDTVVYGFSDVGSDGSFSLELGTPTEDETTSASSYEALGLTVSNSSANLAAVVELTVIDASDAEVGTVSLESSTASEGVAQLWYYADASVTITGTYTFFLDFIYDLDLASGWNEVTETVDLGTFDSTYASGSVSGGTWYLYDY